MGNQKTMQYTCPHCGVVDAITFEEGHDHYFCSGCQQQVMIPAGDRVYGLATIVGGGLVALAVAGWFGWTWMAENKANDGFSEVKVGMTMPQVRAIMGSPTGSQHNEMDVGAGTTTTDCWYWNKVKYQICFMNGKVDSKARN